ncbi:MAG TPA: hypothetical protein GXX59_03340 [Syntrophomonadaceae bacterium]|nr:hypothetical protein [Syntrophomonadaceae bacterium]
MFLRIIAHMRMQDFFICRSCTELKGKRIIVSKGVPNLDYYGSILQGTGKGF